MVLRRSQEFSARVCLLALSAVGSVSLCTACGRKEPEPSEGTQVREMSILLSTSGPILVNGESSAFGEAPERLLAAGAQPGTKIKVTMSPEVPESRRNALVTQLRAKGFRKVVFDMSIKAPVAVQQKKTE